MTKNSSLNLLEFGCDFCYYYTSNKGDYNKHILTAKHNRVTQGDQILMKSHVCSCGKLFKHRQGLWKHKKTCQDNNTSTKSDNLISSMLDNPTLVLELLKQNQEFKDLILEERREFQQIITDQNAKMMELAGNIGSNHHNTTNTTNHNKFNLNVFLNEQCKDAITLKDFVKNLEISMEDFINTGELGFIDGLSQVMIKRINDMDIHVRPIHCTDLKRETVYIKDTHKWEKDTDKQQFRNAVRGVAYKNERMRPIWYEETPEVDILGSANCEKFFKYSKSALGGYGKEQTKSFEDKVIRNIIKEVTIDKHLKIE